MLHSFSPRASTVPEPAAAIPSAVQCEDSARCQSMKPQLRQQYTSPGTGPEPAAAVASAVHCEVLWLLKLGCRAWTTTPAPPPTHTHASLTHQKTKSTPVPFAFAGENLFPSHVELPRRSLLTKPCTHTKDASCVTLIQIHPRR